MRIQIQLEKKEETLLLITQKYKNAGETTMKKLSTKELDNLEGRDVL